MLVYRTPKPTEVLFNKLIAQGLSRARAWTVVQAAIQKGQI